MKAPSAGRPAPLRVGVLVEEGPLPGWAATTVEALRERAEPEPGPWELALAITCERRPTRRPLLLRLYERLDRRLCRQAPDAGAPFEGPGPLDGVPRLRVGLGPTGGVGEGRLAEADAEALRRRSLDVIVDLRATAPPQGIGPAAKHGVWSLHLGDPHRFRDEPALFWELFDEQAASRSVLEAADGTARRVLYESTTRTDPVSLERNRNPTYWKSAQFVIRRLEDLARGRWSPAEVEPEAGEAGDRGTPSNGDTIRLMGRIIGRGVRRQVAARTARERWFLGIRERSGERLPEDDPGSWRVIRAPADRYWADPFLFEHGGETLLFIEQFPWAVDRGELAVGRLDADGQLSDVEPILRAEHHQSYPYVFRDGEEIFMLPESGETGRLELWRATDFPLAWEPVAPLLQGVHAVDASILRHDGSYWMWANIAVPGARRDDEVRLYRSDRLESGWTPHPRNPVVSDARRARPAGRPFLLHGRLIRHAQDCTGRYGSRVVFNEVGTLSPDEYAERPVGALTPAWAGPDCLGAHTYGFGGGWEVTDGMRLVSRRRLRAGG